ncbi:MFS transporter [Costertonia aggregata]|uniref:Endo-1,3-beta-glucanase btgC n=2 Tax=Costertonia aggregata TaxID=343403 RepID=A0A7H9AV10_9FLAO|nr:MFS transporter [Costertonia aggregata]
MGQKIAFGVGMFANQMFPAILGIFMVVLVQDLGFPGWMWGVLFFLPRVFDSITDPIMGFISDNTKSKWGRRRHYVFLGALIMGISFVIMWQLYRENGVDYNFTYFLLWSFVFYLGLTIFSVPYVAMGYEMSNDFHERTDIMAIAQWIGQWAWVIAPWFWVFMYDQDWFPSADIATRELAIYVGIACMVCAMVPAIFIKSKSTINEPYAPLNIRTIGGSLKKIVDGFKEAFQSRPFRQLCIATFFIYNTFYTIASFSFFIVVYYLFGGDAGAAGIWPTLFGSVGALATTFIVIPIITKMSKKMGKKRAFIVSQAISILGYVLLWFLFIPGKPYMFLFALPFFSFGIGSLFTLMMSMTADVIDLDELNTGQRREGVFGAIYWWMVKFGFAIAGLLTGTIMSVVGFDPNAAVQPEGAIFGLRAFYSGFPIIGTLVAIYFMWNYDLTEERANEISKELEKKKASKAAGYGKMASISNIDLNDLSEKEIVEKFSDFFTTKLDFKEISPQALQLEFDTVFKKGMHGICFSAYESGQEPGDDLTDNQIRRRLEVLKGRAQWIRIFSCTTGHEKIPRIAKEMGFKTMVGAWISNKTVQNKSEINSLIKLIKDGHVDIAAVGNEVLYREELNEETIIDYIEQVKKEAGYIPVGYVDAYYEFANRPKLTDACDVVLANCYPFWEGADIKMAGFHLQEMYHRTVAAAKGKNVIITETGWPSIGQKVNKADPTTDNVKEYFVKSHLWAKKEGVSLFYFSSFDESWKIHSEGWAGTSWGLWDSKEKFKYNSNL